MHKYVYTQIYVSTKPKLKKVVSVATHHSFDYNFSDVEFFFFSADSMVLRSSQLQRAAIKYTANTPL